MKKQSHSRNPHKELYKTVEWDDTRYYGLFLRGQKENRRVYIDPKRYAKEFHLTITEDMKKVMAKRHGTYFKPAKKEYIDYNCNFAVLEIGKIRWHWEQDTKPMIQKVLAETKGVDYTSKPYNDNLAMSGILDDDEVRMNATMKTFISERNAENKKNELYYSLYAQFFHQMTSQIEALTVKILTRNGYEGDRFDRSVLYAFKSNKTGAVKDINGFTEYDKMYAIWHFIKHNSLSTYRYLNEHFPDILYAHEYSQGELGCYYIKFNDALIDDILAGVERFLKAYCCLVFDENEEEAEWNNDEYFLSQVREIIDIQI
jgi:hypothetical protein